MTAPALQLQNRQQATPTPRLQQAVRLLQMSSQDFAQVVHEALSSNPFLDVAESLDGVASVGPATTSVDNGGSAAPGTDIVSIGEPDHSWGTASLSPGPVRHSDRLGQALAPGALDTVAQVVSLQQHLHEQVKLQRLSARAHALVGLVIESLDDDGYLRLDHHELATIAALSPTVKPAEIDAAIAIVQALEPVGVAARNLRECLALQVETIDNAAQRALAACIIEAHLDLLARRDTQALARALGCAPADALAACERIRHMDPHPGWRHGGEPVRFVTPDVIAKKVMGRWRLALNAAIVPKVQVNRLYSTLFQQHRDGAHGELAAQLQEARWTVRNVRQRFDTILAVAQAIVRRQHQFLEWGALAMKPLCLKELAEELGLHESTISRVVNNKYMATPAGMFELKQFFSRSVQTAAGGACSTAAIQQLIREMIDSESPSQPWSDADITRQLARQGLVVARRTVTKYRQAMRIDAVAQRRAARP